MRCLFVACTFVLDVNIDLLVSRHDVGCAMQEIARKYSAMKAENRKSLR